MIGCAVDWPLVFLGFKTVFDPIASAAWPISILAVVGIFRAQISGLISRIQRIEGPGVKAEMISEEQQQQQRAALANPVTSPALPDSGLLNPPDHSVYSELDKLAREVLDQGIGQGDCERRLAWAIRMRSISEANRMHETNYRIMFGSQLRALRHLNSAIQAPFSSLRPFFEEACSNPECAPIHEGRSFEDWAQFLFNVGYMQRAPTAESEVVITPLGTHFFVWLAEMRVSDYRPG